MSGRFLIINADDFGVCMETNEAIERLFNEGRRTAFTCRPRRNGKNACGNTGFFWMMIL